ncbi:MAG: hypothetical protein JNM75_05165 [Rhodospirillales bacterium]|nr:hypothetical protein [Rhodospirillales bacterium]
MQKPWFLRQVMLSLILMLAVALTSTNASAAASSHYDQGRLFAEANATLDELLTGGDPADHIRNALSQAHGLLIFTDSGAETGSEGWQGLLFGRDAGGSWTGPAVFSVTSGSFGPPPTDRVGRVMLIALTAVERLIAERIRLGGSGLSVARLGPGPLPQADIVAVTTAAEANEDPQQTFAGTVLAPDQYATNVLYGEPITIREAVASTADIGDDVVNLRRRLDAESGAP